MLFRSQVVAADIHPPPASFADTSVHTTAPTTQLVELLPPVPTRLIEVGQARPVPTRLIEVGQPCPVPTAGTVVPLPTALPYPAHYHPPPTPVTQTVPPPAHSHYTHASVHAYSNFPTHSIAGILECTCTVNNHCYYFCCFASTRTLRSGAQRCRASTP